jgi:diaminohydroxyphosphoribosylaminopyrimidine deaminase/5-amino-6-(5-phosphoribosylamino)uracil reductase
MYINSVIVEGGAQLLQSFIDENLWDEARIITNQQQALPNGIPAPLLSSANFINETEIYSDTINYYMNPLFSI